MASAWKNIFLFTLLFTVVMLINQPVISFNMIYQEQPSIYLANQAINSWHDLLNIYLHPTWLHINIPFFRPSGHFLIYQLLMPIFGWHNLLALNIISFTFLTLIGFFSIKLYRLLFPSFHMGAFIAFSIYLMHPSLSISRLTFMHFDFAYVCFLVLALYLFVLSCKKPQHKMTYFILSLIVYAIAITFKEPAIMLGPVMFIYYCIEFYNGEPLLKYVSDILHDKASLITLFLITATSALLAWYLFLAWPSLIYAGKSFHLSHSLGTANILIKDIFAINHNLIPFGTLPYQDYAWRTTLFTPAARYIMWIFFWISLACVYFLVKEKTNHSSEYKKSLIFLFISALLFTILPLSWASGAPWHHSLTLICLSMIMGFSAEYFLRRFTFTKKYISTCCILISISIALIAVNINFENIIKYNLEPKGFLGISLNRNAILAPPDIKHKLNKESIIVVEDSTLLNDYFMGNSAYPFLLFFTADDYANFQRREDHFFLKFQPVYSGNLFRYAYLMPSLKEELYPFVIEQMDNIPNEIIYNWLKNFNNIFCFGYDASGNWHDKTTAFKTFLAKQQAMRQLVIRSYQTTAVSMLPKHISKTKVLPFPDDTLCQFACDQDKTCKGFIYDQKQCYFL